MTSQKQFLTEQSLFIVYVLWRFTQNLIFWSKILWDLIVSYHYSVDNTDSKYKRRSLQIEWSWDRFWRWCAMISKWRSITILLCCTLSHNVLNLEQDESNFQCQFRFYPNCLKFYILCFQKRMVIASFCGTRLDCF